MVLLIIKLYIIMTNKFLKGDYLKIKFVAFIGAVALMLSALTTSLMAFSFGVGGSFGATHVEIDGTETLKTSSATQTAKEDAQAPLGSAYAQMIVGEGTFGEGNGFAIGYEHIFGQGKRSQKTDNVTDVRADEVSATGSQYAEVVFKNFHNVFVETPGFTVLGLYLKAGWADMDIITNEDLVTQGTWPDASSDGPMYGFGFKKSAGGFQVKTEFSYTDWDKISISSSSDTASTIDATPEQWSFKFGVGYNF